MSDLTPDQVFTVAVIVLLMVVLVVWVVLSDQSQAARVRAERESHVSLLRELDRHGARGGGR